MEADDPRELEEFSPDQVRARLNFPRPSGAPSVAGRGKRGLEGRPALPADPWTPPTSNDDVLHHLAELSMRVEKLADRIETVTPAAAMAQQPLLDEIVALRTSQQSLVTVVEYLAGRVEAAAGRPADVDSAIRELTRINRQVIARVQALTTAAEVRERYFLTRLTRLARAVDPTAEFEAQDTSIDLLGDVFEEPMVDRAKPDM